MNRDVVARNANEMRRQLNGTLSGTVQRTVERTLIRLARNDSRYELYVGRQDIWPDPDDAEIIARSFDAPTDDLVRLKFNIPAQDGQKITVKALRYQWSELPQEPAA